MGFLKSVAILAGGSAASSALVIVATPLLTRLYTPQDFGLLAIFSSIVITLVAIASLRYEAAIPLPDDDSKAYALVRLSLALTLLTTLASVAVLALWRAPVAALLGLTPLGAWLWLIPVALLAGGVIQVMTQWETRRKGFSTIAVSRIAQNGVGVATQASWALTATSGAGLIIGDVVGRFVAALGMLIRGLRSLQPARETHRFSTLEVASRYRRFPIYTGSASLLNTLSKQLPHLLLALAFTSTAIVGWFALATRVLLTPMVLLGQAVGQVFYAHAAESKSDRDVTALTRNVAGRLIELGAPIMMLAIILSPDAFSLVFGDAWRSAGVYAQWLSPWLFAVLIAGPLEKIVFVKEAQRGQLVFQAALLASRVLVIGVGAWLLTSGETIALFGLSGALLWLGYLVWILGVAGVDRSALGRDGARSLLWYAALSVPLLLVWTMNPVGPIFNWTFCALTIALMSLRLRSTLRMEQA